MRLGILVLRLVVGGFFVGHGLQKLMGWFGGHGLEATAEGFQGMGMRPGKRHATLAGLSETAGGALLATGFLTPVGTTLITGTMTTAIQRVHAPKGPWVAEGGYEYNATVIAAAFAIAAAGPGPVSLDHVLGKERSGALVGLAAAGAGALGAQLVERFLVEDEEPSSPASDAAARDAPVTAGTTG